MTRLQKQVFTVCFVATLLICGWELISPFFYYAPMVEVGPDVVTVCESYPKQDAALIVPVKKIDPVQWTVSNTGKNVGVTIRSDYRDEPAEKQSVLILVVMLIGFVAYRWAGCETKTKG
ncbi:MAG: hypothetical protein ACREFR_13895 [Limisphaerales bacterium]